MEREWRPNAEMIPHCPRCGSSNTKFCYYNNYSLTQPRYFCKGCRRYWTKGGSLRNVPVGGGCRKNRRSKSSSLRTSSSSSTDHRGSFPKNITINQITYGGSNTDPANCSIDAVVGSSMAPTDGPNIDLAVVYANYVNQPQEQNPPVVVLELPIDHHRRRHNGEVGLPPFDFSSIEEVPELNLDQEQQVQFNSDGDFLLTCDVSQSVIIPGNQLYMSELDSSSVGIMQQEDRVIERFNSHDTRRNNTFELPPLPGEGMSSIQEMVPPLPMPWLDSQIVSDHSFPSSSEPMQMQMQMQGLESENQDLNQLVGSWSPFNLPNYETLSKHRQQSID